MNLLNGFYARAASPPDIIHRGPVGYILGQLKLGRLAVGEVGSATVPDTAGNFAADDLETILADLATRNVSISATSATSSIGIIGIKDKTTIGANYYEIELPDWDVPGSTYYGKHIASALVFFGRDVNMSSYAYFTPGAVYGGNKSSHRSIMVILAGGDTFSQEWDVRILAFLETVSGGETSVLSHNTDSGVRLATTQRTHIFGRIKR